MDAIIPLLTIIVGGSIILALVFFVKNSSKSQQKDSGLKVVDQKPSNIDESFYVAEDGTIVRGKKAQEVNKQTTSIIDSLTEQKEALSLIQESAEAGVAEAQYYLGLCYEQGSVVPKDLEEAKKWYRLAAGQSYPQAKFRLGKLLMEDKQ